MVQSVGTAVTKVMGHGAQVVALHLPGPAGQVVWGGVLDGGTILHAVGSDGLCNGPGYVLGGFYPHTILSDLFEGGGCDDRPASFQAGGAGAVANAGRSP